MIPDLLEKKSPLHTESADLATTEHWDCEDLVTLFNRTFKAELRTVLVRGDNEPIYLPATDETDYHQVVFAHGFFASALHEISHWCIAGAERRQQIDYGYWYHPDGRNAEQQRLFELAEVKPQALEWIFAVATGHRFWLSVDNLDGASGDIKLFRQRVVAQVADYLAQGLPPRGEQFLQALLTFYQRPRPTAAMFRADEV